MATSSSAHSLILFLVFTTLISCFSYASVDERKVYIVYMGSLPDGDYSPTAHHTTILEEILEISSVSDALVTSYKRSFNGFAANLTEVERQRLASRGEVVSIFPSKTLQLQTSRSWDFMGLLETVKRNHSIESDTIIGVIDSGIWPDSPSFTDDGFSSPPKKWKGECAGGTNFTCNNKLIGAKVYTIGDDSAIDMMGHGSHTSSTAAGNNAKLASFFGLGKGLVRGGVPSARIAMYKVCNENGCQDSSILSAFDDAIADGVDILTISIGTADAQAFTQDVIAIGSFHAMMKNILTVHSAGNNGPDISTVSSVAPWLFSVAASNTDRRFVSKLVIGNQKEFIGSTVNSFSLKNKDYPLVYGKDAGTQCDESSTRACLEECLEPEMVKGKIVICERISGLGSAFTAGAAGAIAFHDTTDRSLIVPFPAVVLNKEDFTSVLAYYNSASNPRANILKGQGLKVGSPPETVSFSSRGPNRVLPDILKPDISAPGVDILAGYSMGAPISQPFLHDNRHTIYSVLSGTSMACPHVAGAAAYVKTFHPEWSASAIKSAIMTTAWPMKNTNESAAGGFGYEFAYGSGHLNPVKAISPGLVYETTTADYVKMLCDIGLSQDDVTRISGNTSSCQKAGVKSLSRSRELNYPSMTASVNASEAFSVNFTRTVTNVGSSRSVYMFNVTNNRLDGAEIAVVPSIMRFKSVGEKKTFTATVKSSTGVIGMLSASLVWSDGVHNVRSPVVVYSTSS